MKNYTHIILALLADCYVNIVEDTLLKIYV